MAKIANVVPVLNDQPANLQDWGKRSSSAIGRIKTLASWGIDHCKGFPDSVSDEDIAEFRLGAQHDYSLDHPAIEYAVIEGNYLKVSDLQADKINAKTERVFIGVDYAFSFNQQEAGKLKETNPQLYAIACDPKTGIRVKCNKYTSNVWNKIVAKGVELKAEAKGIVKVRKPNVAFMEYCDNVFNDMKTRCKNAKAKGDEFANVDKLNKAIIAFKVAIK